MGGKVGAKNFFFVILSVGTLILSVYILQNRSTFIDKTSAKRVKDESITYHLLKGSNFISIPYETGKTSRDLCDEIDGALLIEIWNYTGQNLSNEICGDTPFPTNYKHQINSFEGVFVVTDKPSVWKVTGRRANPNIKLRDKWNAIGVGMPHIRRASDLCFARNIVEKGYRVTAIQSRIPEVAGGDTPWSTGNIWNVYKCGLQKDNFLFKEGVGYFVLVEPK